MKTNKFMRIASVLLIAVIISTCAISGTFAKYTSTSTGSDSARVAKWAFELGESTSLSNSFTFNLFNTVKDSDGASEEKDLSVTDGTIIAPGTSGSFSLALKNKSEVNATYSIDFTVANSAGIPIQFSVDNGANWTSELADVAEAAIDMANGEANINIQWKWAFDGADSADTALGIDGTAEISVTAVITVTQAD